MSKSDWTPEKCELLRALWEAGLSTRAIALQVRMSNDAVISKSRRLNVSRRASPIIRGGSQRIRRKPYFLLPALASLPIATVVDSDPVVLWPRKSEPCCFPLGEPRTSSFRYCDEPSMPGKPYCQAHHSLCWVKPARPGASAGAVAT